MLIDDSTRGFPFNLSNGNIPTVLIKAFSGRSRYVDFVKEYARNRCLRLSSSKHYYAMQTFGSRGL